MTFSFCVFEQFIENDDIAAIKKLIDEGQDCLQAEVSGRTPTSDACLYGKLNILKFFHEKGGELTQDMLFTAIENNYMDILEYLLQNGVKVPEKESPSLAWSLSLANLEMTQFLIEKTSLVSMIDLILVVNLTKMREYKKFSNPKQMKVKKSIVYYLRERGAEFTGEEMIFFDK